ncbi:MAG TPA: methyltransferase domain-containing protein [Thermomicrobiaceae bacterium]|nr:methyltransferase domain-containing protein [Thermomicrobiaceae bacterium]
MDRNLIAGLTSNEVRSAVAERFGMVATTPDARFPFPVGRAFAEAIGYPAAVLDRLPTAVVASFAGAACLSPWYGDWTGLTIADLGCGAGLDSLLLSEVVGPLGQVVGVDLSTRMAFVATENARNASRTNTTFCSAAVEALPLCSASVDVAVANGVFNLSPEKARAVGEVHRVLRPGGELVGAEIVLQWELPADQGNAMEDWFC